MSGVRRSSSKRDTKKTAVARKKTEADLGAAVGTSEAAADGAAEKPSSAQRSSVQEDQHGNRFVGDKMLESSFNEPLMQYRLGNWGNRSTYLPKLDWGSAEDNQALISRFRDLVEARNMDQIRILLHAGVPPNLPIYPFKRTALHLSAERGDELMCQLLLSFKADPLLEDDSPPVVGDSGHWTPRFIAKRNQHLQLTHLFNAHCGFTELLDVGPDPGPLKSDKPMRCHLEAHEPGFMSCSS